MAAVRLPCCQRMIRRIGLKGAALELPIIVSAMRDWGGEGLCHCPITHIIAKIMLTSMLLKDIIMIMIMTMAMRDWGGEGLCHSPTSSQRPC